MEKRRGPKLTYANVTATVALFLALGGGAAYAATTIGENSVGTRQLKRNSVTGAKVKNGSLKRVDFAEGQLPGGERGAVGERGPAGERGPLGERGAPGATSVVVRYGSEGKPKEGEEGESYAACLAGEAVTGGGFDFLEDGPENFEYAVLADRPSNAEEMEGALEYVAPQNGTAASGWAVRIDNETSDTVYFRTYVLCAQR